MSLDRHHFIIALLCTAGSMTPAHAQNAPDPVTDAAHKVSAEQQQGGIEDIVVTATRRAERLQEVPVTVTAISADAIASSGTRDVRSLGQLVPGYTGGRATSVMQPSIRGVGSSGNSVGDESNVAIYVDGVYQGDPYSTQIELVEIERIEVLRGPQGTIFGRNATGGLVNVITPDPSFTTRGRISAKYSRMRKNANDIDIRGYVTTGLSDKVAMDLAGLYRRNDGFITDLVRGGALGEARLASVRSKLLFEASDNARFILTGAYVDNKDQISAQQPFEGNSLGAAFPGAIIPDQAWEVSLDRIPKSDFNRLDLSLRAEFDLGDVNLESTTAYMRTRVHQIADSDASNLLISSTDMLVRPKTFSQELRLLSEGDGSFKWIAGLYAFDLKGDQPITIISGSSPSATVTTRLSPHLTTRSYAAFAEGTMQIVEEVFLTVGGRFTTEKRTFRQLVNGNPLPGGTAESSFDRFTYRAALRYNFAPQANLYASYGTGFKSGVFNGLGTSNVATDPETIKALEAGIKIDPTPWLRANAAIYRYLYDNLQVNSRAADNSFMLQNAATAKIYGGELELTIAPTADVNIRPALVYTHAKYNSFPGAQTFTRRPNGGNIVTSEDASGKNIIRTPRYTLSLGVDYGFDLAGGRLTLSSNVFQSGKVHYDFQNTVTQRAFTLLSADVRWTAPDGHLSLSLFGTNLTNAKVAQQVTPGPAGSYMVYERPIRVGIGAEYRL